MVYLRTGHHTIVTDKVRQVIGVSYDGHFVYWTNVALNTESIVKAREDGSKMEVKSKKYFCHFNEQCLPLLLLHRLC